MATVYGNYTGSSPLSDFTRLYSHLVVLFGSPANPVHFPADYSGPSKVPGSATHVLDARLNLLRTLIPAIFEGKKCLDIGCNAGSVSCQLAFDFHAASVTGIDIDPELVAQAEKLSALRSSRVRPAAENTESITDYFPVSAVLNHGYRIEPKNEAARRSSTAPTLPKWPCLKFSTADWVLTEPSNSPDVYEVILALSVIKWIHLEHLDQGLETFFRKCSSSLVNGGYLVIELQTWDSYEKAIRPNTAPHFSESLRKLQYRPETSFDNLLAAEGLKVCASSTALPRRISVYRKD
ncbi:hypothetical protein P153DRAFT_298357 [Dothidotthia symphoricarpi CBS 119687]|uniref:RNA methyltransferase n=1 Tax=Dothidotthia symphoricarpi CBS 119687 TaxID=1392245 RepID=A0A6A6A391_9PLEO|nr:uncharacterized protein P153DRAFT_298357 [Dothidotthia symphoricarpi CBS 119687]KAF2126280.1 hypothetical protein P153DRAFT_298357 [Dothidotthia symphoricarpi CBS 119687]